MIATTGLRIVRVVLLVTTKLKMTKNPPKHNRIKVTDERLGRQRAHSIVDDPPYQKTVKIRIDPRQNSLLKLDALIHELLHLFDHEMSETKVRKMATYLAKGVWKQNYRKNPSKSRGLRNSKTA